METKLKLLVDKAARARQDCPTLSIPEGMRRAQFFNKGLATIPSNHEPIAWFANPPCKQIIKDKKMFTLKTQQSTKPLLLRELNI